MAITNGYATSTQLQEWNRAGGTAPVAMLERAIEAASRSIDQWCQRHFWQDGTTVAPVARRFDPPCDGRTLEFGAFNDLASSAVTVKTDASGDGTFETTWTTTDYELLPSNPAAGPEARPYTELRATGTQRFPGWSTTGRAARVEVTGIWGWPAVPTAIEQACLLLAAMIFFRKESPQGVAGFGEYGQIRVRGSDPTVIALLDPYRRTAVLVA